MKLALISPAKFIWSDDRELREFWNQSKELGFYRNNFSGISLGLLIVAGLTPPSFEIEFIDQNFDEIDFGKPYDLVGISATTQQANGAYAIADEFRRRGNKVVLGGIHATCLPEEAKQHADSVVIGEAEVLWPRLLEDFEAKRLQPFYQCDEIVDLRNSPIPRYDLIKGKEVKVIWLQTTRGCPHDCEFCVASNVYGRKYRHKEVEQILSEIDFIKRYFPRTRFGFGDDNMFVNRKSSKELLTKLIPKNVRYLAQTDISVAEDDELLGLLKRSGCIALFIGFESLDVHNFETINKDRWKARYLDRYPAYIEKIQSLGIGVMGAFVIGLEHDTTESLRDLGDFIVDSRFYAAQITVLTPLPGSRVRQRLERENRIFHSDWEKYTFLDVVYQPKNMTPQELQKALCEIYKKTYSKEAFKKRFDYFKKVSSVL